MKSVAVISHKGGAGKTSSAVMLAEEFARRGVRTVLVDADRQKGAGLLLGLVEGTGEPRQTGTLRLHYFCASGQPLRDTPARAEALGREFELAVIDTPSLDDPLARMWLRYSTHVLFILPVEPLSIRTMESADAHMAQIRGINSSIELLGILPAIYDEQDETQRILIGQLQATHSDSLITPPIPHDPGLAHRAEQREDRKTEAAPETVKAYAEVADKMMAPLGLAAAAAAAPASRWQLKRPAAAAQEPVQAAGPAAGAKGAPSAGEAAARPAPARRTKQKSEEAAEPAVRQGRGVLPLVIGFGVVIVCLLGVIVFLLLSRR